MTDLANPINRHDYLQPYDELTIGGRPAVFLWWMWKGRNYAKVRFTDNNERAIVNTMDFDTLTPEFIRGVLELANVRTAVDAVIGETP